MIGCTLSLALPHTRLPYAGPNRSRLHPHASCHHALGECRCDPGFTGNVSEGLCDLLFCFGETAVHGSGAPPALPSLSPPPPAPAPCAAASQPGPRRSPDLDPTPSSPVF